MREIEEMLKISKSSIDRHKQRLGLVKKLDIWIPHELKEIHLTKRINACDFHLKRKEFDPFLSNKLSLVMKNRLFKITSFENDHDQRDEPSQTTSKAELHQKKIMLFVWWDWKGVVFFELLPRNFFTMTTLHHTHLKSLANNY